MELKTFKSKTTDELKRLNKISQNFQKQDSSLSPNNFYANAVAKHTKNNTNIHLNSPSTLENLITAKRIQSICNSIDQSQKSNKYVKLEEHIQLIKDTPLVSDSPKPVP